MTRELLRLPIDSDLSWSSFQWAARLLSETPRRLWVSAEEDEYATVTFGDIEVGIDETIPRFAWWIEGDTKDIYSDSA